MEKEALISELKERTGVDNLSERTIDEVASMFLPQFADDEKITDDSWTIPVQMVKTMSGQLRHDLSGGINAFKTQYETEQKAQMEKDKQAAIDAFKTEWEKKHPSTSPKTGEGQGNETKNLDEKFAEFEKAMMAKLTGDDSAFGKLSKQFGDYLKMQAEKEKAATEASIRSQVRDYLIDRGVFEDDFALEYTLEKLVIGENPDISVLKTKAEKDYEANYKKIHKGDGAQPFNGGGASGGGDSNAEFDKFIKERQKKAEREAKDAEALRKDMM